MSRRKRELFHFGSSNPFNNPGKDRPVPPKKKQRGWTLPGYNYLGPGNSLNSGTPVNSLDAAAQRHDQAYNAIQQSGHNPYTHFSEADQQLLDAAHNEPLSVGKVITGAVFGLKKAVAPALTPSHENTAPIPAAGPHAPASKRPAPSTSRGAPPAKVGLGAMSSSSSSETSGESMDTSGSGAGDAGGDLGGGAAGVSKPPIRNGFKWNGNKLIVYQTRRFSCTNAASGTQSSMRFFKGQFEAKDQDDAVVSSRGTGASTTPTTAEATTSASGSTGASASSPSPASTNSTEPTNTTTTTVEPCATTPVTLLPTTAPTPSTTTTKQPGANADPPKCTDPEEPASGCAYVKPTHKRKHNDLRGEYDTASFPPDAECPSKRARDFDGSFRAPPSPGNHFRMYSCEYDWSYVDWNRQQGVIPPSVLQFMFRNCEAWKPTYVKQEFFGLQCVNEVEVGGQKTQNLMPYAGLMVARRNRGQIPWVTLGQRGERQENIANFWIAPYHWPKSPLVHGLIPMRKLHLHSTVFPFAADATANAPIKWNVPLIEHGEIDLMTQTDSLVVECNLNCNYVTQQTYSRHILDVDRNFEILSNKCCSNVLGMVQNTDVVLKQPFMPRSIQMGTVSTMRLSKLCSQKQMNVIESNTNEIFRENCRDGNRNSMFHGQWADSAPNTSKKQYGNIDVGTSPKYKQVEDDGDRDGKFRLHGVRVTPRLDQPIFTAAPMAGEVGPSAAGGHVAHGAIPDQVFFRCEPMVGPGGAETKMMCTLYVTNEVHYDVKFIRPGHKWGGYTMCDIGVGGVDLEKSCAANDEVVFLDQLFDPFTAANAWQPGPVHDL